LSSCSAVAPPILCVDVPLLRTAARPAQPRSHVPYPYQHQPSHPLGAGNRPYPQDHQGSQPYIQYPIPGPQSQIQNPQSQIRILFLQKKIPSKQYHALPQNHRFPQLDGKGTPNMLQNPPIYGIQARKHPVFRAHFPTVRSPGPPSQQSHIDPRNNISPCATWWPTGGSAISNHLHCAQAQVTQYPTDRRGPKTA
jgi:hypothetical protein